MFEKRRFDETADRVEFPHGHAEAVTIGGTRMTRVTYEPGFRWTTDMAGMVGTERCQLLHWLHVLSGRMGLQLRDGTEHEVGPGEVAVVEPEHDSWTVGEEPVVFVDVEPST